MGYKLDENFYKQILVAEKSTMTDDSGSPGCIFTDALNYLNKLGSNLQLRTASLKHKKVSKSRLKDVHNIIKLKEKILQICELSKKSIDVVEDNLQKFKDTSYRKLRRNSASSPRTSSKDQPVFHDGVRIPHKVSLKHYLACKVKSKRLESSAYDKYPTYDDHSEDDRESVSGTVLPSNKTDIDKGEKVEECTEVLKELVSIENAICPNGVNGDVAKNNCSNGVVPQACTNSCIEERTSPTFTPEKGDSRRLNNDSDPSEIEELPAVHFKVRAKKRKRYLVSSECESDNDESKKAKQRDTNTTKDVIETKTINPALNIAENFDPLNDTIYPASNNAEDHDSSLNELQVQDSASNVADIDDPALNVARNDDPALNVARDNDTILNVVENDDPVLNVTRDNDPALIVAGNDNPALNVTSDDDPAFNVVGDNNPANVAGDNDPALNIGGDGPALNSSVDGDPTFNHSVDDDPVLNDSVDEDFALSDIVGDPPLNQSGDDSPGLNNAGNKINPINDAGEDNSVRNEAENEHPAENVIQDNNFKVKSSKKNQSSMQSVKCDEKEKKLTDEKENKLTDEKENKLTDEKEKKLTDEDAESTAPESVSEDKNEEEIVKPVNDENEDNSLRNEAENNTSAENVIQDNNVKVKFSKKDQSSKQSVKCDEKEKKLTDEHANSTAPESVSEDENEEEVVKPLNDENETDAPKIKLKCIDINKLLRPSLLADKSNDDSNEIVEPKKAKRSPRKLRQSRHQSDEEIQQKTKPVSNQLAKANKRVKEERGKDEAQVEETPKNLDKCNKKLHANRDSEMMKRVEEFKSKNFSINLTSLPEFNQNFLESQNLLRIIDGLGNAVIENIKPKENIHNAKNQLLNDSSSDTMKGSSGSERKRSEKNKKMLESIKAKRKLMVMSSSSDTDDELVNNVLRTIKESLQKSSSSNSENEKKVIKESENDVSKRKLISSSSGSSSEHDVIESALRTLAAMPDGVRKRRGSNSVNGASNSNSISQIDGNDDSDENSENSSDGDLSDGKMGRSLRRGRMNDSQDSSEKDDASKTSKKSKGRNQKIADIKKDSKPGLDSESTETEGSIRSGRSSRSGPSTRGSASKVGDSAAEDSNHPASGDELSGDLPTSLNENGDALIGGFAKNDLLEELTSGSDDANSAEASQKEKEDEENETADGASEDRKSSKLGDEENANGETGKAKRKKSKLRNKLLHGRLSESDASDVSSKNSSRKNLKTPIDLDSDFDEKDIKDKDVSSDSDVSDVFKRVKRKPKKPNDSDSSSGKSSLSGPSKKKRRRIKQVKVSSGSETDSDGNKKTPGRKNIRKVMGRGQLEEATKKAAKEERERVARIADRQKLYNNTAFDESGKPDEVVLDKVVLDFDPETKEPLIEVDKGLVKKLKPHQANGIKFMWDACFESVKQIKKDKGSGCILAHCMGLGKTLQVVSLTHTLITHSKLTKVERVLVVCPLSTVLNWVNEYRMWLEHADNDADINVYELSRYKQNYERSYQLQDWLENGGICVLGYEMFRNLSADNPKKFRKKLLKSFQDSLVDPGPDLVVCDEGHLLKNEKTSLSQSMNRVKTLRRIVLTGTPLQNNLKEYYCMVQFVKPNLLGKYNEYLNRFVNPITNGQYTDSTEYDIKIMKRRSHVLHKLLDGAVQRRDYGVLAPFLPPKHEYVLFITLTDLQIKLYQHYMDNYSRRQHPDRKNSGFLFPDFQSLQRIWTHPLVLKANSERYEIMQQKKRDREEEDSEGSLVDFIDDESTTEESTPEESSDDMSDVSNGSKKSKKKKSPKKTKTKTSTRRGTRANPDQSKEKTPEVEVETKAENPTEWWVPLVSEEELEDMRNSNKLVLLFDVLRQCEAIGDKLLVFSQSLYSLDLIEHFLSKIDEATQNGEKVDWLGGHMGSWSPGLDYFRLDGSTSCENRSIWCKSFNRENNPRARLFLISTRAGGLGINLVAANRVVIFDVSWNPSHDVQSIFRVYRFGQKKPCYVYRFLAMGTMEEKIYERQVTKQAISKRVIDEQQIDRHYAENDLAELYTFTPRPDDPRPVPLLPKDRLFAEMLKIHEDLIFKYHEHDSLLENKEEETLTEEERKAAWEDFENEKNKPPPPPMPNLAMAGMMGVNGMDKLERFDPSFVTFLYWYYTVDRGNMLAQQSMALAALTNMLRKDYPTLTEQQLANMLPSIMYQADPNMYGGYDYNMMQKMNAMMGGYAQQPMMNSNMMMSAGSGSGSTGPMPYQSMWQQQQQLQYQRLQQQQAMNRGMKFYAGGLGSRDPVSMALQQQRQRELILAGAGGPASEIPTRGRPRGRPVVPPPNMMSNEVVNLDDSE